MKLFSVIILTTLVFQFGFAQNMQEDFTKISLPDIGKVILSQGTEASVRLETKNSSTHATADVSNGTLTINSDGNVEAYVTVKKLEQIDISGHGSVETEGKIQTKELKLIISGIGKIEMEVEAEFIKTNISGKGTIELSGNANQLNVNISGSGKIDAVDLVTKRSDVNISGAGKVNTNTKTELNVDISGAGSVNYVTAPEKISKSISGIGKVGMVLLDNQQKTEDDTTTLNVGDKKIIIIGDNDEVEDDKAYVDMQNDHGSTVIHYNRGEKTQAHWGGFELGFNNYFSTGFNSKLPPGYDFLELNTGKSIAVNLNVFDWKARLLNYHLFFVTGLGITWNNWRFQNDRTLIANAPNLSANFDTIDYSKNKLTASYATLPLLLEFNTNEYEKKTFHVSAGIILGYRIGSHTKQVYEENGKTKKIKLFDDFNLEPFRYDVTARIGFRGYTFFASYDLNRLFKKTQGPELHPFTFGLSLLNW